MKEQASAVMFQDMPVRLPAPRGPVSEALTSMLRHEPDGASVGTGLEWHGAVEDAAADEDLQLALWLGYELHYRGLAEVSDGWEWHPALVRARRQWEDVLVASLRGAVEALQETPGPDAATVTGRLTAIAAEDAEPSLSRMLMRDAEAGQFQEFLVHRSLYHLKEADGHSWAIPRLSGPVKAALVTIQADEYGAGRAAAMHAQLFRRLMDSWDLCSEYGHYLDRVPAVTLLTGNLISLFGLARRWRGALVGHLAMFEMTSSTPNARYARGHRRLGGDEQAARFFDEHVVADALHEQIALHDLVGGLLAAEPQLAADVVFGARCAQLADELFGRQVVTAWQSGRSSLRER
jgi:hypothetical protein